MKTISSRILACRQLVLAMFCSLLLAPVAYAGQILLKFDDATSQVGSSYSDWGVTFDGDEGVFSSGSATNVPSSPYYLGLNLDNDTLCNVPGGFTGISLYYCNGNTTAGTVVIYANPNGTGAVLGTISLPKNITTAYNTWTLKSDTFATAQSFKLTGVSGYILFDNITLTGGFKPRVIGFNDGSTTWYPEVSNVTATSATLTKTVNPAGSATSVVFHLSPDYGSTWPISSSSQNIGSGTANVEVTQAITGLTPGTTYYVRAVATNSAGTSTSNNGGLITLETTATTQPATSVTVTSAVLNGSVNPAGVATSVFFQHATNPTLTGATNTATQNIGSGTSAVSVNAAISGLSPSAYYYRVVATNAAGTYNGAILAFSTVALGVAVDAPSLTWTTGGTNSSGWIAQTSITHDGVDAAGLDSYVNDQTSWMQTTVTGPGSLTFWWKAASEPSWDSLRFTVDGAEQGSAPDISGNVDWHQKTVSIAPGSHVLRWTFTTDSSVTSTGVWVDEVVYTPDSPDIAVEQPVGTALTDGTASIDFGALNPGVSSAPKTFTITNTGTANLTLGAITKNGTNSGDFTVSAPGSTTVTPGGSTTFTVTFSPGGAGLRSAAIHIASNVAGAKNPFDIALTGTGGNTVTPTFATPGTAPVTSNGFTATGITLGAFTLGYVPGIQLTLVNNTSASPISGTFTNLAQGQTVALTYNGSTHLFTANYNGGTGNDLVLTRTGPGSLDVTFNAGKVTTAVGSGDDKGFAVAVQSDEKVVVAGLASDGTNTDFAVLRCNVDGSLDGTFGAGGRVTTSIGSGDDVARAVAVQSDGKIVVGGSTYQGTNDEEFALRRYNADGSPDTSFGTSGEVVTGFNLGGTKTDRIVAMLIQPDGKIVAAGYAQTASGFHNFAVARYTAAGALDTGFGTGGKVTFAVGSAWAYANAVALQSDGKIVLAGTAGSSTAYDFALARLNTDGTLDTSFDGDGKLTTSISTLEDHAYGVAVQPDGKIVAVGASNNAGDYNVAVVRFTSSGALDTTFSGDGIQTTQVGAGVNSDWAFGVALQADGKIVVAGQASGVGNTDKSALVRYETNGSLDAGFGSGGLLVMDFGAFTEWFNTVAVAGDGKIVAAGAVYNGTNWDITVGRFTASGAPDAGFGGGTLTTGVGAVQDDFGEALVIQPDGKIVQAGYSGNGTNYDFGVVRYNADGTLDTGFNGTGRNATAVNTTGDDIGAAVALQSTGRIVVAGYTNNAGNWDFGLTRYTTAGVLDTTFNGTGKVSTPIGAGIDRAYAVAVQSNNFIVAAGRAHNGTNYDFALVRYSVNGALDTGFDADGKVTTGIGSGDEYAQAIAIQPSDGKIIIGGWSNNGTDYDFALARYNTNGSLDTGFGAGGKVTTQISSYDAIYEIAIQPDGKILAAGYCNGTTNYDFALVRYDSNGTLDTTFGIGGKVVLAVSTAEDIIKDMRVLPGGKILVAGYADGGTTSHDFVLLRFHANGALDTTFGVDGIVTTPIGNPEDVAQAMAIDANGNIVLGGYATKAASTHHFAVARYLGDSTTGAPTLIAPATNAVTASPIAVNFTLPEAAQAGSVKLSFGATELTLAPSQETVGAHSFTFNPANPTASPQIASGSAIPDGTYTVTLSYQDALGNPAATATSTSVTLDTTPPTLSPVTIASNNANPAWAKLGDTVTVSFTASEPIQTPSVTLLGAAATVANPSGNTWTATATVGAGTVEGTAAFSVSATDAVGNAATAVTATTDASLVKVDKTAPTLTPPANILVGATSAAGAAVSFAPGASDNLDPSPVLVANPASGSTFLIGVTTVNLSLTDAAGNSSMGSFTVTVENRTNAPNFANAGTVPLTTDGFNATGLSVGAVALGFNPAPGQVLTLVDNTSANPIGGAFTDLPDGGTVQTTYGGRTLLFLASYLGGDGNDITLTLLNPEIVVEQPATSDVPDGGSRVMPTVVVGTASSLTFTIKNTGPGILNGLTITKDGANEALFTVTASPVAPVNGPTGSTTFTVEFSSATSGLKTAVLHIANDDADENPFDITLTAQALSPADDTDGDGLNDAAEFTLVGLGFDWQVSQPALVSAFLANNALFTQPQYNANYTTGFNAGRTTGQNDVTSDPNAYSLWSQTQYDGNRVAGRNDVINDPNAYSLYTLSQVQSLNVGVPLLTKNPMTGMFKLTIGVRKSTNLVTVPFTAFPMNGPGATTVINGAGKLEFEFPAPGNAAFFRLESQ